MAVIRSIPNKTSPTLAAQCYVPRIIGSLLTGVLAATILTFAQQLWLLIPLILHALVWPHLAFKLTKCASDKDQGELRNQHIEAAFLGCWCVAFQFQFWPCFMLFCVTALNSIVCGGQRHMVYCITIHITTIVVLSALLSVGFEPESSVLTQTISASCLFGYVLFLGFNFRATLNQMRKVRQDMKKQRDESQRARYVAELHTRVKDEFLTNMSLEFRTPMNSISTLLNQAKLQNDTDKILEYVEKSGQALQNLITIVNDILDFANIQRGVLEKRCDSFSLEEMLAEIERHYGSKIRRKNVKFSITQQENLPGRIYGDKSLLTQSVNHLLNNALRFTNKGKISLHVTILEQNCDELTLQFSIKDTGRGLTTDQVSNLFSTNIEEVNFNAEQIGGLGLAITKHYVESMNGTIWVDSYFGHGSTFYFTAEVKLDSANQIRPSGNTLHRILIYSPDKPILSKMNQLINDAGCLTNFAFSPTQVLQQLTQHNTFYNAVLLIDPEPPKTEELARQILALNSFSRPVLIGIDEPLTEQVLFQATELSIYKFDNLEHDLDGYLKTDNKGFILRDFVSAFTEEQIQIQCNKLNQQFSTESNTELAGLKVLVVEDNDINQSIIRNMLEMAEIDVTTASNGHSALAILQCGKQKFDAILMDIQMPEKDGYATTEAIRALNAGFEVIPIIAISAHDNEEQINRAIHAGMNDYVSKPVDTRLLYNKISHWTQKQTPLTTASS